MRKRTIGSLLILVFLLYVLCVSVVATADTTQIEFGKVSAEAGEQVEVPVTITGNPGIAGFRFWVEYDMEALMLVSVEKGEALTSGTLKFDVDDEDAAITWFALSDVTGNGEVMTLTFAVSEDATGDYPLTITYDPEDIVNASWQQVNCTVTDGNIKVEELKGLQYAIENNQVTITGYTGNGGDLILPDTIEGLPVTSIGDNAFKDCTTLTSITIPDSVTSIGNYAFYDCDSLTSVTIPDSVTTIGDRAFSYCWSLISITIPDSVTTIGERAFFYCDSLTSITIPDSVTSIGDHAFSNCDSLTNVTIGNRVTSIGYSAFSYCESLTSITIPDSVTSIGAYAFFYCHSLTDITIPDSVTAISASVFYNCTSLTSIAIPDSVTTIGDRAFYNCTSLTGIWVDENNPQYSSDSYGVLFNKDKTKLVSAPGGMSGSYTIPDSVTTIGDDAFRSCDSLTSITIPDSVTTIGDSAFNFCTSLADVYYTGTQEQWNQILIGTSNDSLLNATLHVVPAYLTFTLNSDGTSYSVTACKTSASGELVIPATYNGYPVTTIGDGAFSYCRDLTNVTIPDSVTTIGDRAFIGCWSLTSTTIPDSVTVIGNSAFQSCTSLTSITIPDSVTTIGDWMFYNCTSLTSTTIPDSVTTIGDSAFMDCWSLTSITIPDSVTTIGNHAFYGCTGLTSITIPNSVTSIGNYAFLNCQNLTGIWVDENNPQYSSDSYGVLFNKNKTKLVRALVIMSESYTIPDSVTSIGSSAFAGCSLTSIAIPDSVTSIGSSAFAGCSLTSITIPDGVTTINTSAFSGCTSLTNITIPDSVTTICDNAFHYCTSLNEVRYKGTEEQWNAVRIGENNTGLTNAAIVYNYGHEHSYKAVVTAPTCTTDGYTTYTCIVCGATKTESIAAKGHTFDKEVVDSKYLKSAATLNSPAIYYKSCACGQSSQGTANEATFTYGTAIPSNAVAAVGHTYYTTVEAAIAAAIANGGEVRLLKALSTASALVITGDVTIDFGGFTYTVSKTANGEAVGAAVTIASGAEVTLKNGKIQVRYADRTKFNHLVVNNGVLHTENITLNGSNLCAAGQTSTIMNNGTLYLGKGIVVNVRSKGLLSTTDDVIKEASLPLVAPAGFHWADNIDLEFHMFNREVTEDRYYKSLATFSAPAVYYKSCACGESSQGTANEATFTYGDKIPSNAVAGVGHTYYTTVEAAIAAAIANGGEVRLLKAQTTANALTISGNVTIDFGGLAYTASKIPTGMTYAPIITITEGATVTLKNGTIQVRAASNTLFNYVIENHGTLITENLAIKGQNTLAPNTETATIKNYGTLTLGEGTTILYKVNALLSTTDTVTKVAALELAAPAGFHWVDNADLQFHTFDQEVAAKVYRKKAATTTATGVYYKSCTCGESSQGTANEATFNYGDLVPENAVARVGENNYYNSIKSALSAAIANGEEVELVKSLSGAAIVINGDVTVDFGGFTYTVTTYNDQEASPAFIIAEGATVTLKNGKIQIRYTKRLLFNYLVENNGTLYTENFTLSGNNLHAADGNATIYNNGTLILGEGTVMTAGLDGINLKSTNLNVTKVRSVTVTDVDGYHWVSGQTLTAHVYDKESIQIQHRKSAPNMNSPAVYYTSCSCGENSKGTAYEATFLYGEKGSNALAEAEIDGYYYRYFDDALAAALENGSTVKLLKDLVTAKPLILNSDVTIDFNGCTYTVNQPTTGVHGYAVAVTIGENAKVNFIGGRLQIRYNRRHLFNYLIENNGTLTTENIVLRGQNVYEPGPSSDTAAILNTGSVTLNAGTVVEIRVNAVNTTNANVTKDANIVLKEAKGYHWSDDQTQLMPHVFDQEIVDINYRKSAATINSPAIFYKTCSCGVNAKGLDENATFEYGSRLGGAAAKVGNTYYASLEEAIAAAIESGETVEVQMAIKNAKALVISGDVTIDFGGYLYTVNTAISDEIGAVITIANGAKVTLKNGTVQVASAVGGKFNALIENNGELYVENIALKGANISAAGAVLVKGNAMTEGEGVTKVDPV